MESLNRSQVISYFTVTLLNTSEVTNVVAGLLTQGSQWCMIRPAKKLTASRLL